MKKIFIFVFYIIFNIYKQEESFAYINDESVLEVPPSIIKSSELPKIETIKHAEVSFVSFWHSLLLTIPMILFAVNQLWYYTMPDLVELWKSLYSDKFRTALGLANDQDFVFQNIDTTHKMSLLQSNSALLYFKIDIKCLNRQDIFYTVWDKIHVNSDIIEFSAVIRQKDVFSVFLGRRSSLIQISELANVKNVCMDYSINDLSFTNNFICLTELPNPLEIINMKFIQQVANNNAHFNYIYVTDLVNISEEFPVKDNNFQDCLLVKISLVWTSNKLWGFKLNEISELIDEFFNTIKNIMAIRLSGPVKFAVDRSRLKLIEIKSKEEHLKRQEMAMKKKDDKIRAMREKIRSESDDKKQIKLQEKFEKLEEKVKNKKFSKGKAIKVVS